MHHATVGFARDVGGRAAYLQLSGKLRLPAMLNPLASVRGLFDDRREYENQIKGT